MCFLDLHQQWVVVALSAQQHHPRPDADAAHPDDFAGRVGVLEPSRQLPATGLQAVLVGLEKRLRTLLTYPLGTAGTGKVVNRYQERRVAGESTSSVDDARQL